jgi:hypothetical protein
VVLGVIYWLFAAALTLRPERDTHIILGLAMLAGFTCYTVFQEGRSAKVIASSSIHALAQFASLVGLTRFWESLNTEVFDLDGFWTWLAALGLEMVLTGGTQHVRQLMEETRVDRVSRWSIELSALGSTSSKRGGNHGLEPHRGQLEAVQRSSEGAVGQAHGR